jgi:hypothetical protein
VAPAGGQFICLAVKLAQAKCVCCSYVCTAFYHIAVIFTPVIESYYEVDYFLQKPDNFDLLSMKIIQRWSINMTTDCL